MLRTPKSTSIFRTLLFGDAAFQTMMRTSLPRTPAASSIVPATRSISTTNSSPFAQARQLLRWRSSPVRTTRRYNSSNSSQPTPTPKVRYQPPPTPPRTLSERMKEMSKKYGWTVVGIYLGLSALDFPFCFLAVRWFGPDRIAHLEHVIVDHVWRGIEAVVPSLKEKREKNEAQALAEGGSDDVVGRGSASAADAAGESLSKKDTASIWTQLLIAYGVHKSLFFIRIPITLAITPRVVKTLRSWGWNIGKVAPKSS